MQYCSEAKIHKCKHILNGSFYYADAALLSWHPFPCLQKSTHKYIHPPNATVLYSTLSPTPSSDSHILTQTHPLPPLSLKPPNHIACANRFLPRLNHLRSFRRLIRTVSCFLAPPHICNQAACVCKRYCHVKTTLFLPRKQGKFSDPFFFFVFLFVFFFFFFWKFRIYGKFPIYRAISGNYFFVEFFIQDEFPVFLAWFSNGKDLYVPCFASFSIKKKTKWRLL